MGATLFGEAVGRSAGEDESGNRTYTRIWHVITSSKDDGARAVAAVLPVSRGDFYAIGASGDAFYESDPYAFVRSIQVEQQADDPTFWICTVEYGPLDPQSGGSDNPGSENPTLDPPRVEWDTEQREVIVDEDINGDAVVNAAGDRFDPPIVKDDDRDYLIIERSEQTFDPAIAAQYRKKLNASPFYGFAAGQVKCDKITASRDYSTLIGVFYRVRYEFAVNLDGWKKRVLNAGMRQLNVGLTDYEPILIEDTGGTQVPVSEPVPLDATGRALAAGGTPVWLEFDIYSTADFDALGLA
jgi:hypothetical protein